MAQVMKDAPKVDPRGANGGEGKNSATRAESGSVSADGATGRRARWPVAVWLGLWLLWVGFLAVMMLAVRA